MNTEEWVERISEGVKCCACCKPLESSKNLHVVLLERKAKWKDNTWGTIAGTSGYALAVVCDECAKRGIEPKYAVEMSNKSEVRYHPVNELEPMSEKEKLILQTLVGLRLRMKTLKRNGMRGVLGG